MVDHSMKFTWIPPLKRLLVLGLEPSTSRL